MYGCIPVTTQFDGPVRTAGRPNLMLGEYCRLGRDVYFETNVDGRIVLGSQVRVNMGTVFVSYSEIRIGNDVLIGEYVSIRDADHATELGTPIRLQDHKSAPICIGNDVWICRGSVILKGVTIGDGAVIGANSVVTKNIPPNAIAVGAPAKVVRYRDGKNQE